VKTESRGALGWLFMGPIRHEIQQWRGCLFSQYHWGMLSCGVCWFLFLCIALKAFTN
jgi:hypothetical protein